MWRFGGGIERDGWLIGEVIDDESQGVKFPVSSKTCLPTTVQIKLTHIYSELREASILNSSEMDLIRFNLWTAELRMIIIMAGRETSYIQYGEEYDASLLVFGIEASVLISYSFLAPSFT
nr:hypothetical protein Iba_chr07dCG3080 [Ipomoea batatas]